MNIKKWLIINIFKSFKLIKNYHGDDVYTFSSYDADLSFLDSNSVEGLKRNGAKDLYTFYLYPEIERLIVSAEVRGGSYVMHFNYDGNRL